MSGRGHLVLALKDSHLEMKGIRPVSIGGLPVFDLLRERADAQGYDLVSPAAWLAAGSPGPAHLLWDIASYAVLPRSLRVPQLRPAVAWTLESPLVAHRAYHRLRAISRQVAATMLFPGAQPLTDPSTRFEPLHWPNASRSPDPSVERDAALLVLVNSNKRANVSWREVPWREPVRAARLVAAAALAGSYGVRGSWTVPDLYERRLEAIATLGADGDLDLYGVGWDRPVPGLAPGRQAVIDRIQRGAVADKQAVLGTHRFVLVIENTVFPGYITEKIFDAMLAGAVPVYLGAPDIDQHVPAEAFVDMRRFPDDRALLAHLRAMTDDEVARHREAARTFFASSAFDRFTEQHFVDRLLELVAWSATR